VLQKKIYWSKNFIKPIEKEKNQLNTTLTTGVLIMTLIDRSYSLDLVHQRDMIDVITPTTNTNRLVETVSIIPSAKRSSIANMLKGIEPTHYQTNCPKKDITTNLLESIRNMPLLKLEKILTKRCFIQKPSKLQRRWLLIKVTSKLESLWEKSLITLVTRLRKFCIHKTAPQNTTQVTQVSTALIDITSVMGKPHKLHIMSPKNLIVTTVSKPFIGISTNLPERIRSVTEDIWMWVSVAHIDPYLMDLAVFTDYNTQLMMMFFASNII
jgi:hypothetical protein